MMKRPSYFSLYEIALLSLFGALVFVHWRQVNFERGVSPISLATIIP